jgi:hypothetical protein
MVPALEKSAITDELKEKAELEIREKRKSVDYNTIEYPVEVLVQKYQGDRKNNIEENGIDEDSSELFIPDYQREMTWSEEHQSKFIESLLLGIPIPSIFVAEISTEKEDKINDSRSIIEIDLRLEIIDGTQRIRTLARFLNNQLQLKNLKKLEELNDFTFKDLTPFRQKKFKRIPIRTIVLTEEADEEVRRDLFERINSGSVELNEMEKRRGSYPGLFLDLIEELSKHEKFLHLCSFRQGEINRRDPQEFVLRFFAFLNNYQNFPANKPKVHEFLDNYLTNKNEELGKIEDSDQQIKKMREEFYSMLNFVEQYFPNSFRTGIKKIRPTTRIKFESLSVGIALALREDKNILPKSTDFINSQTFTEYTNSNGSSSKNKVVRRIQYVRDRLLGTK